MSLQLLTTPSEVVIGTNPTHQFARAMLHFLAKLRPPTRRKSCLRSPPKLSALRIVPAHCYNLSTFRHGAEAPRIELPRLSRRAINSLVGMLSKPTMWRHVWRAKWPTTEPWIIHFSKSFAVKLLLRSTGWQSQRRTERRRGCCSNYTNRG
jgi:hypothetical protein